MRRRLEVQPGASRVLAPRLALLLALFLGLGNTVRAQAQESKPAADAGALNEYGISMALARMPARAESSFISVLSQRRGDARAYNNLGNLSLMKGYYAVALSYYQSALKSDSTDAGVYMNRAAARLLLGDEAGAVDEAAIATRLAGGADRAGELVGLREGAVDSSRAAEKKLLSPAEMRALLRKASRAVPSSTAKPAATPNAERGQGKRTPVWRSGTTRAAEGAADAATVLYWKH